MRLPHAGLLWNDGMWCQIGANIDAAEADVPWAVSAVVRMYPLQGTLSDKGILQRQPRLCRRRQRRRSVGFVGGGENDGGRVSGPAGRRGHR